MQFMALIWTKSQGIMSTKVTSSTRSSKSICRRCLTGKTKQAFEELRRIKLVQIRKVVSCKLLWKSWLI